MPYIKVIDVEEATGGIEKIYDEALARAGYVANIIKVTSLDEPTCLQGLQLYIRLMKSRNALEPARREMLATVVSNANGCFY